VRCGCLPGTGGGGGACPGAGIPCVLVHVEVVGGVASHADTSAVRTHIHSIQIDVKTSEDALGIVRMH